MSIGSKFAIVGLVVPILLILVGSAIAYVLYPTPFLIGLVAALTSADVLVWRELRSTLRERVIQVWDNYLRRIRDAAAIITPGRGYYFPARYEELDSKMEWVTNYGRYGPLKLYPTKLAKQDLVKKLLTAGDDFNSKLNEIVDGARAGGFEVQLYYAFDHWGLRKIPPGEPARLSPLDLTRQNDYLAALDKTKKEKIADLIDSWKEPYSLCEQIVSILDRFGSENGIMPPKPNNPFEHYPIR